MKKLNVGFTNQWGKASFSLLCIDISNVLDCIIVDFIVMGIGVSITYYMRKE